MQTPAPNPTRLAMLPKDRRIERDPDDAGWSVHIDVDPEMAGVLGEVFRRRRVVGDIISILLDAEKWSYSVDDPVQAMADLSTMLDDPDLDGENRFFLEAKSDCLRERMECFPACTMCNGSNIVSVI